MSEKLDLKEFDEDFALFIESGFVAVNQKDEVNSTRLFTAAKALRPEHPAPYVGLGYIALNKLEVKKAVEFFTVALEKEPEHHLAKAFLGIAYLLIEEKRAEGEKMIQEASDASDDPTISNLAEISLEWSEKDLKKKDKDKKAEGSAPFFGQEAKEEKIEAAKKPS